MSNSSRSLLMVLAALCLSIATLADTIDSTTRQASPEPPVVPATEPALPQIEPIAATQPIPSTEEAATEPAPATTEPAVPITGPELQPTTLPQPIEAQTQPQQSTTGANHLHDVFVSGELAHDYLAPGLGAPQHTLGPTDIAALPAGENTPFQQVLLRAPSVAQDSFGQVHVRGEHANLTYRVNGVLLPESISSVGGFGQELDTRIAQSVTLIDGSLPAQFGFRTAGIVDVTTKTGQTLNHNELSLYGGSYDWIQPGLLLGGAHGKLDYFVAASYKYNNLGIENPTSSVVPLHDYTNQYKLFAYFGYQIDDSSRLMFLFNTSYGTFQLPDRPNVTPAFMLAGHPTADSASVNENQEETDEYAVVSYEKTMDQLSFQVSAFSRYGRIHFTPDHVSDLIFQGVASEITNGFLINGLQFDAAYNWDQNNTIRFGFLGDYTDETLETTTAVFPIDAMGAQLSDTPFSISDDRGNWAWEFGFYLQDEWKITDKLTLNYGARYDRFNAAFDQEDQVSPRVNLVWQADPLTAFHVGYARYFAPPPVQYVWPMTLAKFAGTSNAPSNFGDSPPRVERSNYYDAGLSRQLSPRWQVTLDGFYKGAKPLLDSGQFGNAIIFAPFNYEVGRVYGAEISSTWKRGGLSLFGNFAWVVAQGRHIITNQYLFGPDERAFIANHFIKLDHEGEFTASGGISYRWKDNMVYVDVIYGSGLRKGFANTSKEPQYAPVNVGFEHTFHPNWSGVQDVRFRFDIVNVFDEVYQLRNGTGIGVSAAQFGQRRTFLAGLTVDF